MDPQPFSHVILNAACHAVWKAHPAGCTKFKIQSVGPRYTNALSILLFVY
jgi:hypothetical protein